MEEFKAIVSIITWPHITLIFGLIFLFMFRTQIGIFISRIRSVSKDGVTTDTELVPQTQEEKATNILQHIEIEKTVMLDEVENAIFEDLKSRGLEHESDTTKVLVRNLAVTNINLEHEKNYNAIFGSQIILLKALNEVSGTGRPIEYITGFYSTVKENNAEAFSSWELEDYMAFLQDSSLITFENESWHISNKGQDFLIWLARNGKRENKNY
jgi:hypothetical protein